MKMVRFCTLLLLMACWLLPAAAQAEVKEGFLTLSPMFGGVRMEGDQPGDKDGMAVGLGLGYNLTKEFGLEAMVNDTGSDVDLTTYRLDALYRFMPDNQLVPYLGAGVGQYVQDGDEEFMTNWGGGVLYFLADNFALRGDVRHLIAFNESNLEHNLLYTVGVQFQLGSEPAPAPVATPAPAPAPAPVDSDGDGVNDDLDQCPNTPAGVAVDSKGCPLDSDGDGVPDYLDQCPDTPAGVSVDSKGCPLDSDGDGVSDYLDKCPNTPEGFIVDDQGCELKLTLRINFDFDSSVIKPEFKDELKKAADFVNANKDVPYILLTGHTDSKGSDAYNQKLSERRAAAVRDALINNYGLDGSKLVARGYGEEQPVADNSTEAGRYKNRRVELVCCAVLPE